MPVVAGGGRPGGAYPLLGLGQHGPQAGAIGDRRRHQAGVGERGERCEELAPGGGVDAPDQQRAGRGGGEQPEEYGPEQPGHPGIAAVRVDGEVPGAEQRHQHREAGVVQRLGGADPHEGRLGGAAERSVLGLGVQRRTQPAGGEFARRGAQPFGEFVLLPLVGGDRPDRLQGGGRGGGGGGGPAVQYGGGAGGGPPAQRGGVPGRSPPGVHRTNSLVLV
ncbi:hypothetical protein GCM10027615_17450 [Plantactinospora veratri]